MEICVPNKQFRNVGQQDGLMDEVFVTNLADLSPIPRTHGQKERTDSGKTSTTALWHVCACGHSHTNAKWEMKEMRSCDLNSIQIK